MPSRGSLLRRTLAALLLAAGILVIVGGTVVSRFFVRVKDPDGISPAGVGLAWAFWAGFRMYLLVGVCCVLAGFRIGRRRST